MLPHLEKSKINLKLIDAPWTLWAPTVWFNLTKFKNDISNPETNSPICNLLQGVAGVAISVFMNPSIVDFWMTVL